MHNIFLKFTLFPHYRLRVKQTHLWSKSSFASQRTPDKNQSQQENNSKNISFPYIHCFSSLPFSHLCLLSDLPCSSAALLLSTWGSLSQIKNTPKFTRKVPLMHTSVTAKPCFVLLKKHISSYKVIHTSRSAALVVALHCGSGITVPVCQTHAYVSLEYCLMQWEITPHYAGFDANNHILRAPLTSAPQTAEQGTDVSCVQPHATRVVHWVKARSPVFHSHKVCSAHTGMFSIVLTCPLRWASAIVRVHTVHTYTPILAVVIGAVINVVSTDASLETWTKQKHSRLKWASSLFWREFTLHAASPLLSFLNACPVNLILKNLSVACWPKTSLNSFSDSTQVRLHS